MGWLIAAGILVLLAFMPVILKIIYDSKDLAAWIYIGPVKLKVYPNEEKMTQAELIAEIANVTAVVATGNRTKEVKGGLLRELELLLKVLWEVWGGLWRKLRVRRMQLHIVMAAEDPSDLAMNYGKAQIAVANIMPHFERLFVIRKKNIRVDTDFLAEETQVQLRMDLTVTFTRLLILICQYIRSSYKHLQSMNQ